MKKILITVLIASLFVLFGCQSSHIIIPANQLPNAPADSNGVVEFWGEAAEAVAQQIAANLQNEAGRLAELYKYNSILFVICFITLLAGLAFSYLTKSSWGWVIPAVAGLGLLILIFIAQAAAYIKFIGVVFIVVALGILVFKTWQYKRREIAALSTKVVSDVKGKV